MFQERENIKTHIEDNLTADAEKIQVYSKLPDLTSSNFSVYPFIVLPDNENLPDEFIMGYDINYTNMQESVIYHAWDKLSDNRLRQTKQDIHNAFTLKSKILTLRGYKMEIQSIEFDSGPQEAVVHMDKELIPIGFTINYEVMLDVNN